MRLTITGSYYGQREVPQGDHMISILLHLPFLISVPFFSVGIYYTLATQLVAFTAGCAYWNFKFFTKTKCNQNPPAGWSFPKAPCVGLPVCEHLCTVGASLCLKALVDPVPYKRKTGTMGGRWQDLAVTLSTCLIAHRIIFLKLAAVKKKVFLVIVIATLPR